jgi:hypothetical protein
MVHAGPQVSIRSLKSIVLPATNKSFGSLDKRQT